MNPNLKIKHKKKKPRKIPPAVVMDVLERDNYTCQYCGKRHPRDSHPLHIHHRAFKKMGRSTETFNMVDNLVTCCYKCHGEHGALKHARILSEGDDNSKITELEDRYK